MKGWAGPTNYLARRLYNLHLNESVLRLAYKLLRKSDEPRITSRLYRALGKLLVRYLMWAQALVVEGAEPARHYDHHETQALVGGPDHEHQVLTPATAKQLLANQEKIGVIDCLCRQIEDRCSSPRETCLLFGQNAEGYVRSGRGRWLAPGEARRLVDECQEAGLVQNAIIARDEVMGICNCCRCCCLAIVGTHFQIDSVRPSGYVARLNGSARHRQACPPLAEPRPLVPARYRKAQALAGGPRSGRRAAGDDRRAQALAGGNNCLGCNVCRWVCPFGAVNGEREINLERCRGCGLCVIKCPKNHISLAPYPDRR